METKYCPDCGRELSIDSQFCDQCGAAQESDRAPRRDQTRSPQRQQQSHQQQRQQQQQRAPRDSVHQQHREPQSAPLWPLGVLTLLWLAWFAFIASSPALAGLVILLSLPVLYVDASNAKQSGELKLGYPIAVPVAVLLLWVLSLPAYILYRVVKRN